jgi:alpha-1,3-fucosyltransferase 10
VIADAVLYHGPDLCVASVMNKTLMRRGRSRQLGVMMSMESAGYYTCFDKPDFMNQFDMELSYRREVGL